MSNTNRQIPANELDFSFMVTDPAWGKEATKELQDTLSDESLIQIVVINEKGQLIIDKDDKKPVVLTPNHEGFLINHKGEHLVDQEDKPIKWNSRRGLWGQIAYYTRDLRLGNLKNYDMFNYCQEWLNLAGDCLTAGYTKGFMTALRRVITVLELSQSIGGFLRKRSNTITTESFSKKSENDKKKTSVFGFKTKG